MAQSAIDLEKGWLVQFIGLPWHFLSWLAAEKVSRQLPAPDVAYMIAFLFFFFLYCVLLVLVRDRTISKKGRLEPSAFYWGVVIWQVLVLGGSLILFFAIG